MELLRRLLGNNEPQISIRTESSPTQIRVSVVGDVPTVKRPSASHVAKPPALSGDFAEPALPVRTKKVLVHKDERPYHSTTCPYCAVELSPLPKAKKACPSCKAAILVRTGEDGVMYLIRDVDLGSWTAWNEGVRAAEFARQETAELVAMRAAGFLVTDSGWTVDVVGESHYQPALEQIAGGRTDHGANFRCVARLVREPSNPKDSNAVRVVVGGQTVGYVGRDDAVDIQPLLQKLDALGRPAWIAATIVGGWKREDSRGSFGIELDDLPDEDQI